MSRIMSFEVSDDLYRAIKRKTRAAGLVYMSEYIRLSLSGHCGIDSEYKRYKEVIAILRDVIKTDRTTAAKKHKISKQRVGQVVRGERYG